MIHISRFASDIKSPATGTLRAGQSAGPALAAAVLLLWLSIGCLGQAAQRTQEFQLVEGWNAIYLDVTPANDAVEATFGSPLIDMVARYFEPTTQVRFIEDMNEEPWNMPGWSVWYGPQRAESFLTNLHAVHGGAAYLVHAVKAGPLSVTGEVKMHPKAWKSESFNLTGLPVETAGLTFATYFSGVENTLGRRVYRMSNGTWQKVTNLAGTPIKPGEAYWIYCEGKTDYPGPLELRTVGSGGINFSPRNVVTTVEMRNLIKTAFTVSASIEANDGLPLYRQVVNLAELSAESKAFSSASSLGSIEPGQTASLRLELRREFLSGPGRSAILKLTTSNGVVLRLPILYNAD